MNLLLKTVALALCAVASSTHAQYTDTWFSLAGNVSDPNVDTVQLNIGNVQPRGQIKLMDLRVNLAKRRNMVDGEKYTSYQSVIAIDCETSSIYHLEQTRFTDRSWQGASTREVFTGSKPMAFGGLIPSPKPAVLKAACLPK